jgi:hypothetical protein
MSDYTFTNIQAEIVTGPEVARIVGEDVATEVAAAFARAYPDAAGNRTVDLGEHHRTAVLAALREISPDTPDATRTQATEQLIRTL